MKRVMETKMAKEMIVRGWMKVLGKRKDSAVEDAMAARHGEANSDVSDQINEGAAITEIPLIPDSIKEGHLIMEIIPNSLAPSNSNTNN